MNCKPILVFILLLYFPFFGLHAQYPDPPQDIFWPGSRLSLADVESAYNFARSEENSLLSTSIPNMDFPSDNEWIQKTDNEKALWIVNTERTGRGLLPLEGSDIRLIDIALSYAQLLVQLNTFGHNADGLTSSERLDQDDDINGCRESNFENIGARWSSSGPVLYALEAILYNLIYEDSPSNWGHRQSIFNTYNNNSGSMATEGVIGVGMVNTTNYEGPFGEPKNFASVFVMELLDPCSSWDLQTSIPILTREISAFNIFPNPADSYLQIDHSQTYQDYKLSLYSLNGTLIHSSYNNSTINVSNLARGVYFVKIESEGITQIHKQFVY